MSINNKYRFIITTPTGQFQATPDVSRLKFEWKKNSSGDFFVKELASNLRFINSSSLGIFDFDKLHQIERSGHLCDRTEITIEKNCGDGTWTLFYQGYLAMVDGKWSVEKCTLEIKPRALDGMACIVDNWKTERNLLKYSDFQTITRIEGEIEKLLCCDDETGYPDDHLNFETHKITFDVQAGCIESSGWNIERNEMSFRFYNRLFDAWRGEWTICTKWIREKWTGPGTPTSPGWSLDNGSYVRPIPTILDSQTETIEQTGASTLNDALFWQQYVRLPDLENGLSLNKILVGLINEQCTIQVVSNFFGINPDGSEPNNMAYDFALNYLQELMIFEANQLRTISELSTVLPLTLEGIWKDLKTMFNVTMRMTGGVLYIEHVSYFQNRNMLDLTRNELVNHIKGKWEYTYDQNELPKYERWEYAGEPDGYFRPLQVEYKGDCARADEQKTDSYIVSNFVVDVDGVILNNFQREEAEKKLGNEASGDSAGSEFDDLLVLVSTSGGVVNRYPVTPIGGEVITNGVMTWPNLFENLHRWGRKKRSGVVQRFVDDPGVSTEFFSRVYNRTQKDIRIPMCCADLDHFAPEDYVRTQLGWGKVESAAYEEPAGIMTINLLHS